MKDEAFWAQAFTIPERSKPRSLLSRFADHVNVLDFAAVDQTGATESTIGIQAAIDKAVLLGGATVFFPPGRYLVDSLVGGSNVRFMGVGIASCLVQKTGAQYVLSINPGSGGTSNPAANKVNVAFERLAFEGRSVADGFSQFRHLLNLNAVSNVTIDNCQFSQSQGDGIYIGSGNTGGIERHNLNIVIRACNFDGVNGQNRNAISVIDCDGLKIELCKFLRYSHVGMPGAIDCEPDDVFNVIADIHVDRCTFSLCSGGFAVAAYVLSAGLTPVFRDFNVTNCHIAGDNTFNGAGIAAITACALTETTPEMGVNIRDNFIFQDSLVPLVLKNISGASVIGNTFSGTSTAVIAAYDDPAVKVFNTIIQGNSFILSGNSIGMMTVGSAKYLSIIDNYFYSPLSASASGFIMFLSTAAPNTHSFTKITGNYFLKGTSSVTRTIYVDGSTVSVPANNRYLENETDVALLNDFLFSIDEFRQMNMFTYDSTKLPDSFSVPGEWSYVNTTDTALPDKYNQGILFTIKLTTDTAYRKFIVQYMYQAGNDANSSCGYFFRHANAGSNTWGPWHFSGDTSFEAISANRVMLGYDNALLFTGANTYQLLDAALYVGKEVTLKNGPAGAVTINSYNGVQNIDGSPTLALANPYSAVTLKSLGPQWYVISKFGV